MTVTSNPSSEPASPLKSPPSHTPPQQTANVNIQSVSIANLPNSINGLQNVQVYYKFTKMAFINSTDKFNIFGSFSQNFSHF